LESGGNLMAGGGILMAGGGSPCCDSRERGESVFIGSGAVEQAGWGVGTKGRELKSKLNRLGIQGPLRKCFGNV
jgi:hypothetical protein